MITIWKYELEITDEQKIDMPFGARILSVQLQSGKPQLWALVETRNSTLPVKILVAGTGNPINMPESARFVDTFQIMNQRGHSLVFHVFTETFK